MHATAARIEELRALWDRAVERDRPADAASVLADLETLEPEEPRWSQRLGEALRRLHKPREAEAAFVRAAERYAERGFLPHAIAMAKLVASLNPARSDLLASLQPAPAAAPRATIAAVVKPPPPAPLERARDSLHDEIRFTDLEGPSSLDILIDDVQDQDVHEVQVAPYTPPPRLASLPVPSEPSVDRLGAMASFRLFAGLSREALLDLAEAAELVELVPGATVMMRNEPAYALYAIIDGVVRVTLLGSTRSTGAAPDASHPEIRLGEGEIMGEGCLLDEGERQADVRAETRLIALRIEKEKLDAVTERHAAIGDALFQLLARRLVMNLMHASPLFTTFEPRVRLELAQLFEVRRAEPGTLLAEQGKRSDGLYVLLSGNVTAHRKDGGHTRVARGSAFGHSSLVGRVAADETVRAATEAVLLRLPAAKFASLAATYPPLLALLAETAEEPLRASMLPG